MKTIKKVIVTLLVMSIAPLSAMEVEQNSVSRNKKQSLIIIRGTANCGKSTLCKRLCALDSSYTIVSQDDIHKKVTYEVCESVFPAEMAVIRKAIKYENMWQAIRYFDVLCRSDISKEETARVIDAVKGIRNYFNDSAQEKQLIAMRTRLKYSIMEQLLFQAACGRNIIFDSWGITNFDDELKQLKVCFDHIIDVAAHCSLATVLNRWNKRNQDAIEIENFNDRRLFCQSINSFFSFLKPAEKDQAGSLIVTKKEFDLLMQDAIQYVPDSNANKNEQGSFSHHEFTQQDILEFKEKIYIKLGFDKIDEVALVPSVSYDILLCTEGDCDNYVYGLLEQVRAKQNSSQK